MKNTIKTLLVLILALVSVTMVAAADFSVDRVDVDGVTVSSTGKAIYVERGTTVPVTVYMSGSPTGKIAYDARVQAYVGGYEYGKVEDVSDIFEVVPNVSYKKTLRLKIPSDMKATDKYTLNVEIFDDDQSTKRTYTLFVKEARHLVSLYDVIVNPVSNVQAGQPLFVTVRVENMGDNVEDSIKITASMPKLGIEASEYVDQLVRSRDEDQSDNRVSKRDAATTNELMLLIPENAQEGDYELSVKLNYNRGYGASNDAEDEKVLIVHVKSAKQTTGTATASALVNVDNTNQRAAVGEGAVYKVSMANLGKEAQTYSVEVLGVGSWGTSRVDPQNLIVPADKTGESLVYVSPAENAETGVKTFTVKVKDSAGNVVSEKALTLDVVNAQASGSYEAFKKVLEVGFIALLIILVVLGIVLAAKKLSGSNDSVEGQTYYQ
jgi:hypothetical protein